jgi:glucosylceramidase
MRLIEIHETAKDTAARLASFAPSTRATQVSRHPNAALSIDPSLLFQRIEGFGGALTESSGYVLGHLSAEDRKRVIDAFFDPKKGHGFTFARTHMNSSDFSLGNWACDEKEGDGNLEAFSMERTDKYITPLLREAFASAGGGLRLIVTPWSPPAWMKDNHDMNRGGKLLPRWRDAWARYYARFIRELGTRGVPVWALSVQNEPEAVQTWDSCSYTAEEEAEFITRHLKVELERSGLADIAILAWDHNRDRLLARAEESFAVSGALEAIDGFAFHWYSGDQYENVAAVAAAHPDKLLVFTEGCIEGGARPLAWFSGERYAHNIINDLNAGCHAWVDWNIALDLQGGPNHKGNFCDAPVLIDTDEHRVHFQSTYYYLGHFSRFIKAGARRIGLDLRTFLVPAAADGRGRDQIEACAFRNPDESIALVLCNRTEADMVYTLSGPFDGGDQTLYCPGRAIQTLIIR